MPKQKSSQSSRMWLYISEFDADVFSTNGLVLYCKVSEVKVAADKKYTIQQHITRDKHLRSIQKRNEQRLLWHKRNFQNKKNMRIYFLFYSIFCYLFQKISS
jgi:hypothetical protein